MERQVLYILERDLIRVVFICDRLRADIEVAVKSKDETLSQLQAEQAKVIAITAEKDTATAALADSVKQVQDLTTQLEVKKVEWEGESNEAR